MFVTIAFHGREAYDWGGIHSEFLIISDLMAKAQPEYCAWCVNHSDPFTQKPAKPSEERGAYAPAGGQATDPRAFSFDISTARNGQCVTRALERKVAQHGSKRILRQGFKVSSDAPLTVLVPNVTVFFALPLFPGVLLGVDPLLVFGGVRNERTGGDIKEASADAGDGIDSVPGEVDFFFFFFFPLCCCCGVKAALDRVSDIRDKQSKGRRGRRQNR